MRKLIYSFMQKAKLPIFWGVVILCSLALVAQRVYMIRIEERVDSDTEYLIQLTNQNNEIERDITRLLETKQLEQVAANDFGLRAAKLTEVFVLAEPTLPGNETDYFTMNGFFARARRKIDGIFAGNFVNNYTGTGGSI